MRLIIYLLFPLFCRNCSIFSLLLPTCSIALRTSSWETPIFSAICCNSYASLPATLERSRSSLKFLLSAIRNVFFYYIKYCAIASSNEFRLSLCMGLLNGLLQKRYLSHFKILMFEHALSNCRIILYQNHD